MSRLNVDQKTSLLKILLLDLAAALSDEGPMVATNRAYDFQTVTDLVADIHTENMEWIAKSPEQKVQL